MSELVWVCDCATQSALVCKEHPDCRPSYCKMNRHYPPVTHDGTGIRALLEDLKAVFAGEASPHWRNEYETTLMRAAWLNRIELELMPPADNPPAAPLGADPPAPEPTQCAGCTESAFPRTPPDSEG